MSNPIPLELQSKIASWRLKAAEGTLTLDEMREGIKFLREGRLAAAVASTTARRATSKKSVAPAADDMLNELEEM